MKKSNSLILLLFPLTVHASDMAGLVYLFTIPIGAVASITALIISLLTKGWVGAAFVTVLSIVSIVVGVIVINGFSYSQSGPVYVGQVFFMLLGIASIGITIFKLNKDKQLSY